MLASPVAILVSMAVGLVGCDQDPDLIFLKEIFSKYGDGGVMTYEGFEHLLHNLGLGGGVFSAPHELELHRVNGTFSQIHDVAHRHRRHSNPVNVKSKIMHCLSPTDILEVYGYENHYGTTINANFFLHLCPALVYQLDQRLCIKPAPLNTDINDIRTAWLYTGLCVLIISASGLLGVAVMPMIHSKLFSQLLHFLVALAVGTLCGDALLHLLPHAMQHHHSDDKSQWNNPVFKCSTTLLAILLFYAIETMMKLCIGENDSHGHSHGMKSRDDFEMGAMLPSNENKPPPMKPVAFMVLLGDALHNVTDGLAIGAAFSSNPVAGFATSLAIFCHELPHELGDFALLLKTGVTIKKAICCNIFSSILSFVGAVGGLLLGETHASSSDWIYAITAGTFLYIALVDLVPELGNKSKTKISEFFLSFLGILLGFAIMLSIALYEDSLVELLNQ